MTVGHHLEDDVLISVTECRPERVGGVSGAGPVEYHGSLARLEPPVPADQLVPLGGGRHHQLTGREALSIRYVSLSDWSLSQLSEYIWTLNLQTHFTLC